MTSPTRNELAIEPSRRTRSPASPKTPGFWDRLRPSGVTLRAAARRLHARRAFTLMEMMLVVAVLVAVAALVWPALQGPLDDQRLLKSADLIRAQWTKARVTAMKNGQMYVFRYVTASNEYAIEPWSGNADSVEASQTAATQESAALPRTTDERPHPLGIAGQRLPDGIQFFSGQTQTDARLATATTGTATGTSANSAGTASSTGEPQPIVFYPDGSTSDATLVLTNERFFVQVTLRGLTGMVRVSELLSSEEIGVSGGSVQ